MNVSRSPQPGKPVTRISAAVLVAVGTVLALLAIFADTLEVGGGKGFGYQQLIGLIGGIVLILCGLAIAFQRYFTPTGRDSFEVER